MERASIVLREFVGPDLRAVKHAQDANGIVVDQVGRDIGRARQARACQRCARPAALRKVELAPRGVGDPFVDMNGGTEAFGFGRSGIRPASPAMALTAWGPQAPAYAMSVRIIAN
jgi:hypothetical protein